MALFNRSLHFIRFYSATTKAACSTNDQKQFSEIVKQLSKFSSRDDLLEYSQRSVQYQYPLRMMEEAKKQQHDQNSLIEYARFLNDELKVRVAHCISHFQMLPFLPAANPTLLRLHERYLNLFEKLNHFPEIVTKNDEEKFSRLIQIFMESNTDVIGQLSNGCRESARYFKIYDVMKQFLDNILLSRLSMRLLGEHYVALRRPKPDWLGAIYMKFILNDLVQGCINDVSTICHDTYGAVPAVVIDNNLPQPFPYFPSVVEYILRELLKNSMRAVVEHSKTLLSKSQNLTTYFESNRNKPLIKVTFTSDPADEHFDIVINDLGGGVADEEQEKIFEYMYTGQSEHHEKACESETDMGDDILSDFQERMVQSSKHMFGYGFGLPVCRLYAQCFNGSLNVRQIPSLGTDVYLRLSFIETTNQNVKI
ncbi:unnamed protein product [Didymodactylos carnosus]|uniref:Protein-serine/threonine kinase n=1 Tax=Didymodactylos carnosus TaxID=1234261 RepID=A0A814QVS0_9BILA|nr:unnamed protein product [Didymodactylos carnosus]CAF1186075.1 unnamed protein product [Didymodactylos carnosus]CAF3887890.1 unnamed protein product [Didymodactylos carnosus]CAF3997116.1 unnamed protein product [Didymodactylos carnosus]